MLYHSKHIHFYQNAIDIDLSEILISMSAAAYLRGDVSVGLPVGPSFGQSQNSCLFKRSLAI